MNLIIEHLKARRPGLAQNTYTTYARSILRLRKVSADLVPKEIDKYLETLPVTTARNLLTALIVFDGERIARLDAWSKRHERYDALAASHRDQQSMSDYESAHWVSWKKVLGAVKRMREDVTNQKLFERGTTKADHRLLSGYIAMSIHSKFQWRNDVPSIRVVETSTLATNKKHNYFVLSVGKFIFHDFKTATIFKRRKQWPLVLEVPPKIVAQFLQETQTSVVATTAFRETNLESFVQGPIAMDNI